MGERVRLRRNKPNGKANGRARMTRQDHAASITASWQKQVSSIVATGKLLLAAKEGPQKLPHGEFGKMVDSDLPFGARTAQSLMLIARHPVLSNAQYLAHLPASLTTLTDLAQIPPKLLLTEIEAGAVHPDMKRADVANLGWPLLHRVEKSLDALVLFMDRYPDPAVMVDELGALMGGRFWYDEKLRALGTVPAWLTALHAALEEDRREDRRERNAEYEELCERIRAKETPDPHADAITAPASNGEAPPRSGRSGNGAAV